MPSLPTGTVTFLFTDIEGSTTLLQRLGDRRYAEILTEHQRLLRNAFVEGKGQEVDTQGDAFLVAFARARDAVATAVAAQQALMKHTWPNCASLRVRMGLHTGEPVSATDRYVGVDVHRASRICAAGHGGQILLSEAVNGLLARDLTPGVSLRNLGTHRLKDLQEPERIFQIVHPDLPADFPPLKSLDVRPNNLPRQLTSFIGREKEIAEVKRLLSTADLVTLTGTGGAGKTRLALQVAADLLDTYPDGVWLAELASLSDPALVAKAVAAALDVPEQPGCPLHETLVRSLPTEHLLLVLDNCEHVLSACQDLANTLLRACPRLRILATSREALGVDGEVSYRVPSLRLPDLHRLPSLATLVEYEAVRLFAERAALSQPGFSLTASNAATIAQICHRLDGIPLAIEFAAARVKILSLDQIAARLDDRFRLLTAGTRKTLPRHQTLRATMDWSYDLLSEQERTVLRRLSVFAGGWTLESAEAICSGDGVEASDILDLLTQLVDKSLVVAETRDAEARYRLLETVRQYARDRLQDSGEANDVRRRHRDWYQALAEQAYPEMFRGQRLELWLERLETEHDNLRAALQWSKAEKDGAEAGLRLAGALWWLWFQHDHWSEGVGWLEGALARSAEAPPYVLPWALFGASQFAWRRRDYALATTLGENGLVLCRGLGNKECSAWTLLNLGIVSMRQEDYERATRLFDESLNLSHELANDFAHGTALVQVGIMARYQGDYERSAALHSQSLALLRKVGNRWSIAYALSRLGFVAVHQSNYGQAAASFTESLIVCRETGNRWISEECLEGFARVASAKGECEKAARLFGAAEVLREAVGWHPAPPDQAYHDQCVASARAGLEETAFAAAWAEGRAMTLEQAVEYTLTEVGV